MDLVLEESLREAELQVWVRDLLSRTARVSISERRLEAQSRRQPAFPSPAPLPSIPPYYLVILVIS